MLLNEGARACSVVETTTKSLCCRRFFWKIDSIKSDGSHDMVALEACRRFQLMLQSHVWPGCAPGWLCWRGVRPRLKNKGTNAPALSTHGAESCVLCRFLRA